MHLSSEVIKLASISLILKHSRNAVVVLRDEMTTMQLLTGHLAEKEKRSIKLLLI